MRYIIVPGSVAMVNFAGEQWKEPDGTPLAPATFVDFMFGKGVFPGRLADPKFSGMRGINAVCAMQVALRDLVKEAGGVEHLGGRVLAIEDDHWSLLKSVTEDPSAEAKYLPALCHVLKPFMRAIVEATDTRPSVIDARVANGGSLPAEVTPAAS